MHPIILTLRAKAFAHFLPEATRINQLHGAFAMRQLAIAEYPDISANARVVEHIGRQANNGFHKVVLPVSYTHLTLPTSDLV